MGFDAVFLNTSFARAGDPVAMAHAFGQAVSAKPRLAFEAGLMPPASWQCPRPRCWELPICVPGDWLDPAALLPGASDAAMVAQLVPQRVRLVQLRFKVDADDIAAQIAASMAIWARHVAQLVVNDHWRGA